MPSLPVDFSRLTECSNFHTNGPIITHMVRFVKQVVSILKDQQATRGARGAELWRSLLGTGGKPALRTADPLRATVKGYFRMGFCQKGQG